MHLNHKAYLQWLTCICCPLQTLHSLLPVAQDIVQQQPIQVHLKGLEYMNDDPSAMHVAYLGVQDPADQAGSVQKLQQLCTAMVDAHADAGLLLSRDERCCSLIYVLRCHVPTPACMHGIVSIHAMCMRWPIMTNPLLMALRRLGMLIVHGYRLCHNKAVAMTCCSVLKVHNCLLHCPPLQRQNLLTCRDVKLHATVLNTRHRQRARAKQSDTQGVDTSEKHQRNSQYDRMPIDGRWLLANYADLDLGVQQIPQIHLSQRGMYRDDGYYQAVDVLSL